MRLRILPSLAALSLLLVVPSPHCQAQEDAAARAERALHEGLRYSRQATADGWEKALQVWSSSLDELRAEGTLATQVHGLLPVSVGNAHKMRQRSDSALMYIREAMPILKETGLRKFEAIAPRHRRDVLKSDLVMLRAPLNPAVLKVDAGPAQVPKRAHATILPIQSQSGLICCGFARSVRESRPDDGNTTEVPAHPRSSTRLDLVQRKRTWANRTSRRSRAQRPNR